MNRMSVKKQSIKPFSSKLNCPTAEQQRKNDYDDSSSDDDEYDSDFSDLTDVDDHHSYLPVHVSKSNSETDLNHSSTRNHPDEIGEDDSTVDMHIPAIRKETQRKRFSQTTTTTNNNNNNNNKKKKNDQEKQIKKKNSPIICPDILHKKKSIFNNNNHDNNNKNNNKEPKKCCCPADEKILPETPIIKTTGNNIRKIIKLNNFLNSDEKEPSFALVPIKTPNIFTAVKTINNNKPPSSSLSNSSSSNVKLPPLVRQLFNRQRSSPIHDQAMQVESAQNSSDDESPHHIKNRSRVDNNKGNRTPIVRYASYSRSNSNSGSNSPIPFMTSDRRNPSIKSSSSSMFRKLEPIPLPAFQHQQQQQPVLSSCY